MLHAERLPIEAKNALYPTQLNSAGDATLGKRYRMPQAFHNFFTWHMAAGSQVTYSTNQMQRQQAEEPNHVFPEGDC